MKFATFTVSALVSIALTAAFPAEEAQKRSLSQDLSNVLHSFVDDNKSNEPLQTVGQGIVQDVKDIQGVIQSLELVVQSIVNVSDFHSIWDVVDYLHQEEKTFGTVFSGLAKALLNGNAFQSVVDNYSPQVDNLNNINLRLPSKPVWPKAGKNDAPYSLLEIDLRKAIHIPSGFEYGKGNKKPVIFVPGTGAYGGDTFHSNYIKLLQNTDFADPVWLNIPDHLLRDAQLNAEFVAYAINYISGISQGKKVSIISWSQGGLISQWALKYWPSTRDHVGEFIPISPDFHGTKMVPVLCPAFPKLPCAPSIIQQDYDSHFVTTLQTNDGNSAYVPTTTIFSGFDYIVEPQSDHGSSTLQDVRNVGVGNYEFQKLCPNKNAGGLYTHGGALYNPVGFALAVDALKNGGVGSVDRIDLNALCDQVVPNGLDYADVLTTELEVLYCGVNSVLEVNKVLNEPAIQSYAK